MRRTQFPYCFATHITQEQKFFSDQDECQAGSSKWWDFLYIQKVQFCFLLNKYFFIPIARRNRANVAVGDAPEQWQLLSEKAAPTLLQIASGRGGFEREHGAAAGGLPRFAQMCLRPASRWREFQTY